ncbi:hypothetical protein BKA81DRAFT_90252 [Phyllosticta paracitricarpa]
MGIARSGIPSLLLPVLHLRRFRNSGADLGWRLPSALDAPRVPSPRAAHPTPCIESNQHQYRQTYRSKDYQYSHRRRTR